MPLVLASLAPWLDPTLSERDAIRQVVRHLDADAITHWPVSLRINRPSQDDADLIVPLGEP